MKFLSKELWYICIFLSIYPSSTHTRNNHQPLLLWVIGLTRFFFFLMMKTLVKFLSKELWYICIFLSIYLSSTHTRNDHQPPLLTDSFSDFFFWWIDPGEILVQGAELRTRRARQADRGRAAVGDKRTGRLTRGQAGAHHTNSKQACLVCESMARWT